MSRADPKLPPIKGLRGYWAHHARRSDGPGQRLGWMAEKIMLDLLGLGIEQTSRMLAFETPDFDAFRAWIVQVAGMPDPVQVDRYHVWLDGRPMPAAAIARLEPIEAADPALDEADLAHFDAHGYVVLRQAITPTEVRAAADLVWRAAGADPADPSTWYGERQQGIMVQVFQDAAMQAARRSPRIHKAFAQLWGSPDLWSTTDRLGFSAPVRPGEGFRATPLHWDASLAVPIAFATQGVLYLSDTAADQGAFTVVPGFHHRIEPWLETLPEGIDPRRIDLSAEATFVPGRAGDLVIWRQDLPHAASPNRAAAPRLVQYVNMYAPSLKQNPVWR